MTLMAENEALLDFGAAVKDWRFIYRSSGV
jgi:hypothetical protein